MSLFYNSNNNDNDSSSDGEVDESLLSSLRPEVLLALLEVRNNHTDNNNSSASCVKEAKSLHPISNKVFAEKSYW